MKQSATKKAQARVLAKAQQITVNFRILDDAELLDIIANFRGLCAHICMDKFRGANQDPHTAHACYRNDIGRRVKDANKIFQGRVWIDLLAY